MNTTAVKTRRIFDETFKHEAIQNWLNSGKSVAVIAQKPGLKANRLHAWRKPGSLADVQGQLEDALRENRHLREPRDILKKTLGILSEPSTNAMPGLTR